MTPEIWTTIVEKRIRHFLLRRSCAYEFKPVTFDCISATVLDDKMELMRLVDVMLGELVCAVNILEHPHDQVRNYVKSCQHAFNAGWSEHSDVPIFFLRRDRLNVAIHHDKNGFQSHLFIFIQNRNMTSIFVRLNDTLAADRIWYTANLFPRKK
jgi:hypothetical protein